LPQTRIESEAEALISKYRWVLRNPSDTSIIVLEQMMSLIKKKLQRTKLHQLGDWLYCSIIGTCLTLKELWQLGRKLKLVNSSNMSDYELHRVFVDIAGESGYESRRLQKYLDQKYQLIIQQFAKLTSVTALTTQWQEALNSGEIAGAYWALLTHPLISTELLTQVYGEVHMLSHLSGASLRVNIQELNQLRQYTKALEEQLAQNFANTQTRLQEKDKLIHTLNTRLATAMKAEHDLQECKMQQEALARDPLIKQLRQQINALSSQFCVEQAQSRRMAENVHQWKSSALTAKNYNLSLEQKLAQTSQERDSLEAYLAYLLSESCTTENCPNKDLCGRRILFVGGRASQCEHFRRLVEQYNGYFLYHDGGREESHSKLESTLCQADAVLCPLDCISHDAMSRVKRYCEHNLKPLVMMPHASLSAFVKGLTEVTK
jgi:hypothetical protein